MQPGTRISYSLRPDGIAVPAARSAARDAGNQPGLYGDIKGRALGWLATGVAVAAAAYATYAAVTWFHYGRPSPPAPESQDPLLDRFMPSYDVAERHHIRVSAPAEITLAAASEADLLQSPTARVIFRAREVMLGSDPDRTPRPRGLLALTQSLGWRVLAEVPGREIVVGAVTQPWKANVTFHGLSPDEFATFNEPGFVKIAWTLRADASTPIESVFRTETRAVATDAFARARFRRYWSFLSPGIIAIRAMTLQPVKAEAERRARSGTTLPSRVRSQPIRDDHQG